MRHLSISQTAIAVLAAASLFGGVANATKKSVIDARVNEAIKTAEETVPAFTALREDAVGMLVIPSIKEGGFIVGGAYGEGALREDGETVSYYSFSKGSAGLQAGFERHDMLLLFLDEEALKDFRTRHGWQAGVEGKVTLVSTGAQAAVDTTTERKPVVGFIVGQKGLLGGVSLTGGHFHEINPE